eukprot:gene10345-2759_t
MIIITCSFVTSCFFLLSTRKIEIRETSEALYLLSPGIIISGICTKPACIKVGNVFGKDTKKMKLTQQTQENKKSTEQTDIKEYKEFDDMNLKEELLRGIYSYGFEKPSKIQQKAIVPIITTSKDIIAQAHSGTGKTGTFTISMLQNLDFDEKKLQGIILAPTRELAQQIQLVLLSLGERLNIKTLLCVGGTNVKDDILALKEGVQIVVGTPGRVIHMISDGCMNVNTLKMLAIDEADEMLSIGFKDQIYEIFQFLPEKMQVCLFSATMPPDVLEITQKFMIDPIQILVKKEALTLEGIKQYYICCGDRDYQKFEVLCDIYKTITICQCVIFVNSKKRVDQLASQLNEQNFTVSSIHGDMDQNQRQLIMKDFRNSKTRILIATDILARGIDIHHVSLVINYDLPRNVENYIHRIGRSGRYGRKGVAINFVTQFDLRDLKELEKYYETNIQKMPENLSDLI